MPSDAAIDRRDDYTAASDEAAVTAANSLLAASTWVVRSPQNGIKVPPVASGSTQRTPFTIQEELVVSVCLVDLPV